MDKKSITSPSLSTRRHRRGQTLVEFALSLPILLLLLFGIIEFARIFQAWVTLQNAARAAARYAITGNVELEHLEAIADELALSLGDSTAAGLSDTRNMLCQDGDHRGSHAPFGPYSGDFESAFANYWDGLDCEPGSEDDLGLINDMGRIFSIREQARVGAASLDVRMFDEEAYQQELDPDTNEFVRWANDDVPGWFHVFICSSRPTLRENDDLTALRYQPDRDALTCNVQEWRSADPPSPGLPDYDDPDQSVNNLGQIQWDAGGPGDAVEIIVTFNHPLITPLALPTYVRLQARRVMINEAFRASRVVNLPPVLARPTSTPSNTPPPTDTDVPSETPPPSDTPTETFTPTSTGTPTLTPTPDCSLIYITGVSMNSSYLQVRIQNDNFAPVELQGVELAWRRHTLYPDMYTDFMQWNGRTFWDGQDTSPPWTTASDGSLANSEPTWNNSTNVTLNGVSNGLWQARFGNAPSALSQYFNTPDFTGSIWHFSNGCTVSIDEAPPTAVNPDDITDTPEPICGDYRMTFEAFWPHGVVQFSVLNFGNTPIRIEGINLYWVYYFSGMNLNFVSLGGANAYDPATVKVWEGRSTGTTVGATTNTPMGSFVGNDPNWLIDATINPGDSVFMWLDFDGTSANLQSEYDAFEADFNGTTIAFDNGCDISPAEVPTPVPPMCGDSIVQWDRGEQCDAGANNGQPGSYCDANCQYTCGNGQVDSGEACDDGNRNSNDGCSSSCQIEECGDGITQWSMGEQCDDGNTNSGDGCSSTCQNECGNGRIDGSEQCDDGNGNNNDQCTNWCTRTRCGDGILNNNPSNNDGIVEQCDDRNTNNGDGCSSTCQIEPPVCGNNRTESGEQCDDGNLLNGDGCSSTCRIEPPVCGNGRQESGEQCDDGNTNNGDGCSSTCQTEATSVCGDGVVDPGEECDWGSANVDPDSGELGCTTECKSNVTGTG